jgi:Kdo2-lipid IVA lauroyltransferase/acyltransferase
MHASNEIAIYWLIRFVSIPFQWMPYSWIQIIGRVIGSLMFHTMHKYRKRTLSNLALAKDLVLTKKELIRVSKESFQNLAIVCLEYPRLSHEKRLSPQIICENPETVQSLNSQGKGIVFFCGHLSNWEILFLDRTSQMKGIAVAKPIHNKRLYRWILSIREKYGGKIIAQSQCMKEGLRALKKGNFIGIVGDQGMPSSGYSCSFLGRLAWTTTAPALLAFRTSSPLIFAETRRVPGGYRIRYSDPIWPDPSAPMEEEVPRLMNEALKCLQKSIKNRPGEWLWQHNRWKQQTPQNVYKRFRYDALCLILPPEKPDLLPLLPHLETLKQIYPLDFLFVAAPEWSRGELLINANETFFYRSIKESLLEDYRFKIVFNFSSFKPIRRHYLSLSAFEVLTLEDLKKLAKPHLPPGQEGLSDIFKRALCRPGSLWSHDAS